MYNFIKNSYTEVFQRNVITGTPRTLNLDVNINHNKTTCNNRNNNSKNVNNRNSSNKNQV